MAGIRRRPPTDENLLTQKELLDRIRNMDSLRNQALVAFGYLSGGRIGEISEYKKTEKMATIGYNDIGKPIKQRVYIRNSDIFGTPIMKKQIKIEMVKGMYFLVIRGMRTLKRKANDPESFNYRVTRRTIAIPVIPEENDFIDIVKAYIENLGDGDYLFPMTRQRCWQIINYGVGLYPHYLRHMRVSYFVSYYNLNDQQIQKLMGWANTSPMRFYAHLRLEDMAEGFINALRNKQV